MELRDSLKTVRILKASQFIFLIFLVGCASSRQYVPLPDLSRPIENTDQGRIYVLRATPFGCAISMKIREGVRTIGVTGPNSFLVWDREPGHASIVSEAEDDSVLDLEVEKGQTYYIQQHVKMGLLMARNELELLSDDRGKTLLKKCKAAKVELKQPKGNVVTQV